MASPKRLRPALALALPLLALVAAGLAVVLATTGGGDDARQPAAVIPGPAWTAEPTATPSPPPPAVAFDTFEPVHQGLAAVISGRIIVASPEGLTARLDFGDGASTPLVVRSDGTFSATHVYRGADSMTATVSVVSPQGSSRATAAVDVVPRVVIFAQGMNSESRCPDGDRFLDRAPEWVAASLGEASTLPIAPDAYRYFSYSGAYCDSGIAPEYERSDTCAGIDAVTAPRLRALVESVAPSKVTIVAHSMGGLVAAYLVGSDPAWAQEHIASVATFDSPLQGIDGLRAEVLAISRISDSGCGRSSAAMSDLRAGSSVTTTAAIAARAVPFFTLDGSGGESGALGLAEAVPDGRTTLPGAYVHLRVGDEHSQIWNRAPRSGDHLDKGAFVACAVVVDRTQCPVN